MDKKIIITPTDRAMLEHLRADPLVPFAHLAEQLDLSPQHVSHRVSALEAGGVLNILGRTLPSFTGRVAWIIRANVNPASSAAIAYHLAQQSMTRWVRLSTAHNELMCGVVQGQGTSNNVFEYLAEHAGVTNLRVHEILMTWTAEGETAVAYPDIELDELDYRIMRILARNGRTPIAEIARETRSVPSTVSRRRARLIDHGVLYFEADVDHRALGYATDAMLWIKAAPGSLDTVGNTLRSLPQCRFAAAIGGQNNIVANVIVKDKSELVQLVDEHLGALDVQHVEIVPMNTAFKRASAE